MQDVAKLEELTASSQTKLELEGIYEFKVKDGAQVNALARKFFAETWSECVKALQTQIEHQTEQGNRHINLEPPRELALSGVYEFKLSDVGAVEPIAQSIIERSWKEFAKACTPQIEAQLAKQHANLNS